jgi:hypothetical protein
MVHVNEYLISKWLVTATSSLSNLKKTYNSASTLKFLKDLFFFNFKNGAHHLSER